MDNRKMHTNKEQKSTSIGRREFLALSAVTATAGSIYGASKSESAPAASGSGRKKDRRPNILVITTDQQWAEAMSCTGNPYVKTPAMDSLAHDGMLFENAYSSNPICVPSRSSYMTGMMPHEVGVTHNLSAEDVDFTAPCLGRYFKDAGYDTGYIGKWHVPRDIYDRQWSGFDLLAEIKDNEVDPLIVEPAKKFINQERNKPFLLFTSFVNPHDICEWARMASGIDDHLKNGDIGEVPAPKDCPPIRANCEIPEDEPAAIRKHQQFEGLSGQYPTRDWSDDDGRWRQYLWAYYRLVEKVDGYIWQVIDALRGSGKLEDTLVILTSDHGDGIGSHRWNQKSLFYDEVAKIPFIVSWRGSTLSGARNREHLVNLGTDLLPTMLDAAGIKKPENLRGISVLPAAMGKDCQTSREYIVSENNLHEGWAKPGKVNGRMVRSSRYKYVIYSNSEPAEQFFDMELDPGEVHDLSKKTQYAPLIQKHREMLREYMQETNDTFPA